MQLLSEVVAAYVTQQAANGRSIHTQRQIARHGRLLVSALNDPPVARVKHEAVAAFFASDVVKRTADGSPRRASSANALRSSVRGLFAFAHAAGYAPSNAARLVRRSRVPPARPRALPEPDVARLLNALQRATAPAGRRDRVMVLVMLKAGLRVGSVVALDVEDLVGDQLVLRRLKGGGDDSVYLPRDVVAVLVEHIGERRTGPMFEGERGRRMTTRQVARRLAEHAERAGIEGANPHALRHRFGCDVFERTGDVLLTARAMCHRSVASTAVYARPAEAQLRAAVGA